MRLTIRRLGLVVVGCLIGSAALAQDVKVSARVDRTTVAGRANVRLAVEISGPGAAHAAPPDVSALKDFEIAGGPSVSSSFQWINGRTTASKTFTYTLRPRSTGALRIPALGVLVGGRTYRTRAIGIQVLPQGAIPPTQRRRPGRRAPRPGVGSRPSPGNPPEVRVRAEVDTQTAYVGQQITLRLMLHTQAEVLNLGLKDNPNFPGFWAEDIKLPEKLDLRRVQIAGEAYSEITLMKKGLFPTSAGQLTIPPVTYRIQIRRRSRDPFESFFFTPTDTLTRSSEPIRVTVKPLPETGRPPSFSGAVGRFNLSVTADRQETQVNDAMGLKVRVSGEGNLNSVSAPPLPDMSDFKEYEPKVTATTTLKGDRFRPEKIWDYVMIPLAPGDQTIPPVYFSYFDPEAGEYRSVSSPPIPIQVARHGDFSGTSLPVVSQSDVRLLRRDIHYIKTAQQGLKDRSRFLYRSRWFAALVLLPVAVNLGLVVVVRRRDASPASARLRRGRRARSRAVRGFKEARRQLASCASAAFYAAVAQTLTEYLGDKFDMSGAGLTHQRIEELLASRNAPVELRTTFHRCLEACDYARFAPTSSNEAEMRRTLETAQRVVADLERAIRV